MIDKSNGSATPRLGTPKPKKRKGTPRLQLSKMNQDPNAVQLTPRTAAAPTAAGNEARLRAAQQASMAQQERSARRASTPAPAQCTPRHTPRRSASEMSMHQTPKLSSRSRGGLPQLTPGSQFSRSQFDRATGPLSRRSRGQMSRRGVTPALSSRGGPMPHELNVEPPAWRDPNVALTPKQPFGANDHMWGTHDHLEGHNELLRSKFGSTHSSTNKTYGGNKQEPRTPVAERDRRMRERAANFDSETSTKPPKVHHKQTPRTIALLGEMDARSMGISDGMEVLLLLPSCAGADFVLLWQMHLHEQESRKQQMLQNTQNLRPKQQSSVVPIHSAHWAPKDARIGSALMQMPDAMGTVAQFGTPTSRSRRSRGQSTQRRLTTVGMVDRAPNPNFDTTSSIKQLAGPMRERSSHQP